MIDKVINHGNKKLYRAFVDFSKAFDRVYRNGIWFKLLQEVVFTKLLKMLQKIYDCVTLCIRVNGDYSNCFESLSGVKLGEPLSPLLLIFFVNDMYDSLYDVSIESICIEEISIFLLLFADDTVLFSYTKEGLQSLLYKLHRYCDKWGISVNLDKTVVMVCKKGRNVENVELICDNHVLKQVNKFTYLGVTLSANGCFYQAQKSLSEQAKRALFSLNSLFYTVSLGIEEKIKLFKSMINPIMNYGCEVWGFHKGQDIERLHLKFLKQVLKVIQHTTSSMVYGELGRVPMYVIRKIRIVKIIKNPDLLISKIFNMRNTYGQPINRWALKVKKY